LLALGGEEVDANHRSPALRSARPTATAAAGSTFGASCTPNFAGSNAIFENGLNASIVVLKRASSASAKPSTR